MFVAAGLIPAPIREGIRLRHGYGGTSKALPYI